MFVRSKASHMLVGMITLGFAALKNKNFFLIILSYCIVLVSQGAMAATYYVSPSGDDLNPGTSAQRAWRTLDKVNVVDLNPGDSVLLEAGHDFPGNLLLTAEDGGTPTQPVVIGSYGSGRARIKAGNGSGITVQNAGGVEVKDLIVTGDDYRTNFGSGIKIVNELPNNQKLEYIRVHNVEASGFGRVKYETGYSVGFPNGCGIVVGGFASDESKSGYRDIRITKCAVHQNEYFGILITGYYVEEPTTYANSKVYIGYCKIYDNPGDSEYSKGHSGSGILMLDVDGGVIEYCEAYNNGYNCGRGEVGIWVCTVNNIIIQFCESHHNRTGGWSDGGGFDFDGGTTNSILQYNYSHDNDGAGYLIYSYQNAPHTFNNNIVRYNISVNDGQKNNYRGIIVGTGSPKEDPIHNTQIYGNTIYASISPAISIDRQGIYNTKVCNNLFITANNQKLVAKHPDKSGATFAGNAYWAVDGKYDIAGHKSLEEWRKATGQEMLNGKPVGMVVDPKLIDLGKSVTIGDPTQLHTLNAYKLQKDSPLIDAGIDLRRQFGIDPGDKDFYGNPIPNAKGFDIGAYEITMESTANSSKYLDAVREFAYNVLKYGRDTYGPKHTPLFVDGLNVRTREPVKWKSPKGDVLQATEYNEWIISNFASPQTLMRTLDGLSILTGDSKYRDATKQATRYVLENLRSPNGLIYWGHVAAYDAQADRANVEDSRYYQHAWEIRHVLKLTHPYYELM